MRELIVCFVILNLALANGQYSTKKYEYPKTNLIHSDAPVVNEKLVYGVCEGSGFEKKCTIYQESVDGKNGAIKSCDLKFQFTGNYSSDLKLQNNGKDYVFLTLKDDGMIRLVTLNMISCSAKETRIKSNAGSSIAIIQNDLSYDVVFENSKLCKNLVCKATYDYNGNIIKKVTAFGIKAANSTLIIKAADQGFLVGELTDTVIKVHLVRDSVYDSKLLFYRTHDARPVLFSSSTDNNKLSFCTHFNNNVVCYQYDAEGNLKRAIEYPMTSGILDSIDVLNLENGFLALSMKRIIGFNGQLPISIAKYDDNMNKLPKFWYTHVNCREGRYSHPKLYINSSGDYSVAAVCQTKFYPWAHAKVSNKWM